MREREKIAAKQRRKAIALVHGDCPECGAPLDIAEYRARCPRCRFAAGIASAASPREGELSELEYQSLLMLGAFGGKVVWVYCDMVGIEATTIEEAKKDPAWEQKDYIRLLGYFNALTTHCKQILEKKQKPGLNQLVGPT